MRFVRNNAKTAIVAELVVLAPQMECIVSQTNSPVRMADVVVNGDVCAIDNGVQVCKSHVGCKKPPAKCGNACCDAGILCVNVGAQYRCELTWGQAKLPSTTSQSVPSPVLGDSLRNTSIPVSNGVSSGTTILPVMTTMAQTQGSNDPSWTNMGTVAGSTGLPVYTTSLTWGQKELQAMTIVSAGGFLAICTAKDNLEL